MARIVLPRSVEIRVVFEKLSLGWSFLSLWAVGGQGSCEKSGSIL